MAISYVTALRTTRITDVLTAIDAGSAGGKILLYTGASPGVNSAVSSQVLLATLTLSDPAGTVSGAVLTFSAITADASADASGTAGWARLTTSEGATVADLSVGLTASTADIRLNTLEIVAGGEVSMSSGSLTEGNA